MSRTVAGSVLAESLKDWRPGSAEMMRRVDPWPAAAFAGLIGTPSAPPLGRRSAAADCGTGSSCLTIPPGRARPGRPPADGAFLPPIPGRRRMFAGGRLRMDAPILIGAELSSRSSVAGVSVKSGRSGDLAFVTVRHELVVDGGTVGVEEQDVVYRSEPDGTAPRAVPQPETGVPEPIGEWRLELATDPVLLFRFSALTYNGHRIHYDRPYATQVENYPDLVVHGPLLALLALELARVHAPDRAVRTFDYRLVRPAFVPSRIVSAGRPDGSTVGVAVGAQGVGPSLTAQIGLE